MLDAMSLRRVIAQEKPDLIVPEMEAVAADVLVDSERPADGSFPPPAPRG